MKKTDLAPIMEDSGTFGEQSGKYYPEQMMISATTKSPNQLLGEESPDVSPLVINRTEKGDKFEHQHLLGSLKKVFPENVGRFASKPSLPPANGSDTSMFKVNLLIRC